MTGNTNIDWWAVTQAAQGLGINTRRLVALHDPDAALEWALRMSREHSGVAALSYYELAVLLGYRTPEIDAGASLEWNDLLRSAEQLRGAVRAKVDAERAAAEKAEAERRAAEAAAAKAEADRWAAEVEAQLSVPPVPEDEVEEMPAA